MNFKLSISVCLFFIITFCFSQQIDSLYVDKQVDSAYSKMVEHPKIATEIAHRLIKNAIKLDYFNGIRSGYNILSGVEFYEGNLERSNEINDSIIKLCIKIDSSYLPEQYYLKALTDFELDDYYSSTKSIYDALNVMETYDVDTYRIDSYVLMSDIQLELGNYDEATHYAKESYIIAVKTKDSSNISYASAKLTHTLIDSKNYDSARYYLDIQKKHITSKNYYSVIDKANYHYNAARYYYNTDSIKKALNHAKLSFNTWPEGNLYKQLDEVFLGKVYIKLNDYDSALKVLKRVFENTNEAKNFNLKSKANFLLSKIYKHKNQINKAYEHLNLYKIFNDSMQLKKDKVRSSYFISRYENEKKDNELNKQKLKITSQEAKLLKQERTSLIISSALILVCLIFLIFLFVYRSKIKSKKVEQKLALERLKTKDAFIKGEESERKRISVELHDGVNSYMSAMKFFVLSKENEPQQNHKEFRTELVRQIDEAVNQIRNISFNLSPSALSHFGLIKALSDYCYTLNNLTKDVTITFDFIGDKIPKYLQKEDIGNAFYRIVQELITNALKHAKASNILVQISHEAGKSVSLTVEDDGVGFDLSDSKKIGLGLKNIKSRAEYIGATFDFVSDKNGTSASINIDLSNLNQENS